MKQFAILLAALVAAFTLAACGAGEAQSTETSATEPATSETETSATEPSATEAETSATEATQPTEATTEAETPATEATQPTEATTEGETSATEAAAAQSAGIAGNWVTHSVNSRGTIMTAAEMEELGELASAMMLQITFNEDGTGVLKIDGLGLSDNITWSGEGSGFTMKNSEGDATAMTYDASAGTLTLTTGGTEMVMIRG